LGELLLGCRLPGLRPAFVPALAPLTHSPPFHPIAPPVEHAGGRAGMATHTPPVWRLQRPSAAKTGGVARKTARSTSCRRRKVEHAARLGMQAAAPAEQHTRHLYGACEGPPPPRLAAWPARLRAPPQAAAAKWSKPPGLPCRRPRRQSNTHATCTGVSTPSGPQDCALHLMPSPQSGASRQAWHIGSHVPVVGLCPFPIAAVVQAAFVG